jgi:hypothetical protein
MVVTMNKISKATDKKSATKIQKNSKIKAIKSNLKNKELIN